MAAKSACPVQHITVEGAAVTFNLRVATDYRIRVLGQYRSVSLTEDPLLDSFVTVRVLLHGLVPVMVTDPAA